jgi:CheY-like chemotaxis protein
MDTDNKPIQKKTALVVDDSKLARYVLKEMLLAQNIRVETAESAEEALGSLSAWKPDVIFMDHMMPGMDGFQAVQAIKNDPKTAMIPIMMYTSKDGGVYVSQARALGAVGVLPKKLKPVQLEKVLQKLKLIPEADEAPVQTEPKPIEIPAPKTEAASAGKSSLEELALSASEELEKDSMRHLFRQLFNEQRDSIKQDQHELVESMASKVTPLIAQSQKKSGWARAGSYLAVIAVLGLFAFPLYNIYSRDVVTQGWVSEQLAQQANQLDVLYTELAALDQEIIQVSNTSTSISVGALEWAINQNTQLPYQQPLNSPENLDYVNELLEQLNDNQFEGLVVVKYHAGEFCEEVTEQGDYSLPATETKVVSCQRTEFDVQDRNQLGISEFERYLSVTSLYYPGIDVRLELMGSSFTVLDYPDAAFNPSADTWNYAAAMNNRFEFELLPSEPTRRAALSLVPVSDSTTIAPN